MSVGTWNLAETVSQVVRWAREPTPATGARRVFATSVHGLIESWRDPSFRAVLGRAALVVPDGMPLVWVGRLRGQRTMTRVSGPDLMAGVCREQRVRHFFYGGAPGVARSLVDRLLGSGSDQVAGWFSPPFRHLTAEESDEVVETISASHADIVWVGLGTPKQERWAAEMGPRLRTKVIVTVGAAFDYHTGRLRRAPQAVQRLGLEWAYRVIQEPRRLWRRYLTNNPLFVMLVLGELLGLLRFEGPGALGRGEAP